MHSAQHALKLFSTGCVRDQPSRLQEFLRRKADNIGLDKDNNPVFLAPSGFLLNMARQDYPEIVFHTTSDFKSVVS